MYEELIKAAIDARKMSYAPYSNFPVGAAIMSEGKIFQGCNIENASFGATNCAERTAIFKAVSEGYKTVEAVAVIGDVNNYTFPCGICRQVIAEFAKDEKIPIIIVKNEKEYIMRTLEEIMPGIFSKEDLSK